MHYMNENSEKRYSSSKKDQIYIFKIKKSNKKYS